MFKKTEKFMKKVSYKIIVTDEKQKKILDSSVYDAVMKSSTKLIKSCSIRWVVLDKFYCYPTLILRTPMEYYYLLDEIIRSEGYCLIMISKNTLILKRTDTEEES